MARTISAADVSRRNPIDFPPTVRDASTDPPSFPLEVRPKDRTSYAYTGGVYQLQATGDSVLIRISGIDTAVNAAAPPLRLFPFSWVGAGYGTFIYVSDTGGPWNIAMAPYPYSLDPENTDMTHGEALEYLPPDFYSSIPAFIWNFQITRTNNNSQGVGMGTLEIWRDGDVANKVTNDLYYNTEDATGITVLVGNPEAMANPYLVQLNAPVTTTAIVGVTHTIA